MATRNFTLIGTTDISDTTGTITINGVEVFTGTFINNSEEEAPIAIGSIDIDDSVDTWLPVSITVTNGDARFGMFKWNYGWVINPLLTPEEAAYARVPAEDVPAEIVASVTAKGGFYVRSADQYSYGSTPEQNNDNRNTVLLNGVAVTDPDWYYINTATSDVLTFNTLIFARA
jgi:hypothetical protein